MECTFANSKIGKVRDRLITVTAVVRVLFIFISGPRVKPFVGNFPPFKGKHIHLIMEELKLEYGRIIGLQAAGQYFVMVAGGKEALEAMKKEDFLGRPLKVNNQPPRPGIMFTDGDHWAEQRKFTMKHLREFGLNKKGMERLIHREVEELFAKNIGNKNKHNVRVNT